MRDRWVLFWHIFGFTAFFALIALLIALLVTPRSTRVPSLAGLAEGAAITAVTDASLRVGNITRVCSDTVAAGLVINQDPAAGARVRRNSTVDLAVSTGPCTVAVPDVSGLTQADATASLASAGLATGSVTSQCSSTVPAGSVISQSPAANTRVTPGSAVNLVVSTGPCPVTVPALAGISRADAIAAILAAGLAVGDVGEQCDSTAAADAVISQSPAAGTQVAPGSAVNLVVSTGPCPVTVPNVTGLEQAAAETAITQAGLAVGEIAQVCSDAVPAGLVISQDPAGDTQVAPGSAVNLVVSTGPCPVTVPNVTGLEQAAAETAITQAGLAVGEIAQVCSDAVPAGLVISQDPAGDTQVAPGSAVNLVVSTGPCPVTVPNVTGLEQAAAEAALAAEGLYTGLVSSQCDDTVAAGAVISQSPAAGTQVAPGATVDIVISTGQPVVPDVTGMELAEADTTISAVAGLSVNFTIACSDTVPSGQVASQNPAGGTTVSCGTTVEVVLSTGVCPVTVPDVTGMELDAAAAALQQASLLYTTTESCSDMIPAGSVAEQDPAGGEQVPPGSTVALVISNGPCPVAVPDVLGLDQASALAALAQASLLYVVTEDCDDTVPADHVAAQDPAGGTLVLPGSQ
ncbi:MAG TPA: PASTA domain-containing protein, partial [Candidatus Hydrogenedentes bacterium]|nr:PASTA domain-containing protein [Candidatus Hydrogenedentota bacterium]